MPNVPSDTLPIYPTYQTVVVNGVTYKSYAETDWHQVITEDGISLYELLQNLPDVNLENYYHLCGTFVDTPNATAIEQLYALNTQAIGDVYLVRTNMLGERGYVYEMYTWGGNTIGWIFSGTTNKKLTIQDSLTTVLKLIPDSLGEPGQSLVVNADGTGIVWGAGSSQDPTQDLTPAVQEQLALKADKIIIFNDYLPITGWEYDSNLNCFYYIYTNSKIPHNSYFEISTVFSTQDDIDNINESRFFNSTEIAFGENGISYATIRARSIPEMQIQLCIKVFGVFTEK